MTPKTMMRITTALSTAVTTLTLYVYLTFPDAKEEPSISWCFSIPLVAVSSFTISFIAVGHFVYVITKIIKP